MDTQTIIRAWKDPEFRALLSPEQRQALPENPSGKSITELDDSELEDAVGGFVLQTARVLCSTETIRICPTSTVLSFRYCPSTRFDCPVPLPL
ncbi:mersacidin/lichenicidin family type 2 lantibiotic [Hyalangium versicolor]|uniref:mersacidin/lichenicidin family type 2 lantibiotic n=1 Tax=Hyalangium versicolor TaxID=2861190 RepID=UPI001CCB7A9D|nr:mersacidin/lichenicidin family type 2 lantibiotic [Hyalangium versicolor]